MSTTANQRIDVGALRNDDAILVVDAHANERQEIAATLRYDYDQLGSQGAAIREHAIEIKRSEQQANSAVVEAGRHLLAVKEALPHGQWETWLETEFHMTDRTARTLMNIAERFDGKTEIISVLNVTVLGLLSAPSVPDAAVEAVAAAATNGKVTVATAKEIIAQHQPARPYLSIEEVLAGLRSTSLLDGLTGRQVWEIARNDKHQRFIACQKALPGRVRQHELINALYKIAEERGTKFDGTPVHVVAVPQGERSTWDYWAAQGWRLVSDKSAAAQNWPHLAGLHDGAGLATPRLLSEAAVVHWLASGGKLSDQNYRDFAGYDTIRPAAAPGRSAEIEAVVRRQIERQGNPITVGDLRTIAKQRIGRLWRDCLAELPNSVQFSELSRAINNVADMLERTQPPAPPLAAPAEEDNQEPPAESAAPPLEAPGPLEIEEALWPCVRQDNAHIDGQIQSTFPGSAAYWAERVGWVIGKPITAMQMAAPLNRVFQALLAERASQPGFVPLLKTPPAQLAATEAIAAGQLRQMQIEGLRSELNDALGVLTRFGDITGKHTETLVAARELRRLIGLLDAEAQP